MHPTDLLVCLLFQCSKHSIIRLLHSVQLITHREGWSWTETVEFKCDLPVAVQPNELQDNQPPWVTVRCEMNDNQTNKGIF